MSIQDGSNSSPLTLTAVTNGTREARIWRVGDFVAGMTDRYAVARYRELVGEPALPELF